MSRGGHCNHERGWCSSAWECQGLWWYPPREELHSLYRHGWATFLWINPRYVLICVCPQPLHLAASPFCPRLVVQPRLCPQQFGSPSSRPREYRLTWKPSKREWQADSWAQISHNYVSQCFILAIFHSSFILVCFSILNFCFSQHSWGLRIRTSKSWQNKS